MVFTEEMYLTRDCELRIPNWELLLLLLLHHTGKVNASLETVGHN